MSLGMGTLVMWILAIVSLLFVLSLPAFISDDIQTLLFLMPFVFTALGMALALKK